jgi:hypothetical protein
VKPRKNNHAPDCERRIVVIFRGEEHPLSAGEQQLAEIVVRDGSP